MERETRNRIQHLSGTMEVGECPLRKKQIWTAIYIQDRANITLLQIKTKQNKENRCQRPPVACPALGALSVPHCCAMSHRCGQGLHSQPMRMATGTTEDNPSWGERLHLLKNEISSSCSYCSLVGVYLLSHKISNPQGGRGKRTEKRKLQDTDYLLVLGMGTAAIYEYILFHFHNNPMRQVFLLYR